VAGEELLEVLLGQLLLPLLEMGNQVLSELFVLPVNQALIGSFEPSGQFLGQGVLAQEMASARRLPLVIEVLAVACARYNANQPGGGLSYSTASHPTNGRPLLAEGGPRLEEAQHLRRDFLLATGQGLQPG
jgi:hypothetical protein